MSLGNFPKFLLNFSQYAMKEEDKHFYQFKSFRLNVEERQLMHNDTTVPLTPKAFDVLALLVERGGHLVEKDDLLKEVWTGSFVEEANVARVIHTLRKVLGEDENDNKFIETVAKKGYRFVAEVTEVSKTTDAKIADGRHGSLKPVAAPSAGESRTSTFEAVETAAPPKAAASRKTRFILFTIGFLSAVFLLLFLSFNFRTSNQGRTKSLAVLPLKPISTANRDDIYEIGIADSLIHRLSRSKNFNVRPLSATRKYSDITQDPVAAGREQKVDYVLASNYQLVGGKIRITSQLISVSTGRIEDTFQSSEIDAANIFTMQDMIAGEVGDTLLYHPLLAPESPGIQWRLGTIVLIDAFKTSSSRIGTENEEAYRLYLHGKSLTMRRNEADARKAVEHLEQAIRLDPKFALAYAGMAQAYRKSNLGGASEYEKVNEFISKALELDPNLAEAYVARADSELLDEWNFPAVEKDLLHAIELEPNCESAHWLYSLLLAYRGRFDEALKEIETAQAIDPGAAMYKRDRGRILYYARRYDEAIAELKLAAELEENMGLGWLRIVYSAKGDEAMAYQTFIKIQKRAYPDRLEIYQKAYETAGWTGVMRKLTEFLKTDEKKADAPNYQTAMAYAGLGEKDRAFEYLNKAFEKREWRMLMLKVDPILDNLRDDPRFDELVARVGIN